MPKPLKLIAALERAERRFWFYLAWIGPAIIAAILALDILVSSLMPIELALQRNWLFSLHLTLSRILHSAPLLVVIHSVIAFLGLALYRQKKQMALNQLLQRPMSQMTLQERLECACRYFRVMYDFPIGYRSQYVQQGIWTWKMPDGFLLIKQMLGEAMRDASFLEVLDAMPQQVRESFYFFLWSGDVEVVEWVLGVLERRSDLTALESLEAFVRGKCPVKDSELRERGKVVLEELRRQQEYARSLLRGSGTERNSEFAW